MATQKTNKATDDFPPGVAAPARRALNGAGYTQLKQLTQATEGGLMQLHGVGPKAMDALKRALRAQGLSFASPKKNK